MSHHKTGYVLSHHGILCCDMSFVTTVVVSLMCRTVHTTAAVHVHMITIHVTQYILYIIDTYNTINYKIQ